MHPDDGVTVGTEAMSDAARPRPITARMVEEGRGTVAQTVCVPCLDDPHIRDLAWSIAKLTALAEGRGVRVVCAADYLGRMAYEFMKERGIPGVPIRRFAEERRRIKRLLMRGSAA
jgi:hypothetical protein